ncbi:thioredoxin [Thermoplasmatales archaeon SG8-52-4]|nr:MAG: thioredoxin [Thermoplasmatales archaeon SG8-52-4]
MVSKNLIILDDKNWEKIVEKGDKSVAVMFSSPTCPYCKQMEPYFKSYSSEFKENIVFAIVDISKSPTIASRYGVMGTPTFKFFCNGKPIYELVGSVYPHLIKKAVEDTLVHGPACEKSTTWHAPEVSPYA